MNKKLFLFFSALLFATVSVAEEGKLPWKERKVSTEKVKNVENVGIKERLGEKLDLSLNFINEKGENVQLGSFFNNDKPVLLTMVYYTCPSLCNFHLNGVTDTLKKMKWTVGDQFELVAVSFEPKDTPKIAAAKKQSYIDAYGRADSSDGWHFLTSTKENAKALADQVGFSYEWDTDSEQWAHPAVAYVITPNGKISRYMYGIQFSPETLRLSLVEAGLGKVGNVIDKFILYCFNYDPKEKKYSLVAFNVVRAGAMATVVIMSIFLIPFWIRYRREDGKA